MIVFNTTYHVDSVLLDDFITWLRIDYIPAALQREELSKPRLSRVLTEATDEGVSLSLQFYVENVEKLSHWYDQSGYALAETLKKRFGDRVVGFNTLLEIIDLK